MRGSVAMDRETVTDMVVILDFLGPGVNRSNVPTGGSPRTSGRGPGLGSPGVGQPGQPDAAGERGEFAEGGRIVEMLEGRLEARRQAQGVERSRMRPTASAACRAS